MPSREDYAAALRECGALGPEDDIRANPDLVIAAQAHWHAAGHNACVFAGYLSEQRDAHGWESYVLDEAGLDRQAQAINEMVPPRLVAPETEVVSVLLPYMEEAEAAAELLRRLDGMEDWEVSDLGRENDEELGALIRLGLRARVEFDHWSEVLGFGPMAGQARTRLAPFTELAIRAKPPARPRRSQRAYMADIEVPFDNREFGRMWATTHDQRGQRLGQDHETRGKAKVTFVIKSSVWGAQSE